MSQLQTIKRHLVAYSCRDRKGPQDRRVLKKAEKALKLYREMGGPPPVEPAPWDHALERVGYLGRVMVVPEEEPELSPANARRFRSLVDDLVGECDARDLPGLLRAAQPASKSIMGLIRQWCELHEEEHPATCEFLRAPSSASKTASDVVAFERGPKAEELLAIGIEQAQTSVGLIRRRIKAAIRMSEMLEFGEELWPPDDRAEPEEVLVRALMLFERDRFAFARDADAIRILAGAMIEVCDRIRVKSPWDVLAGLAWVVERKLVLFPAWPQFRAMGISAPPISTEPWEGCLDYGPGSKYWEDAHGWWCGVHAQLSNPQTATPMPVQAGPSDGTQVLGPSGPEPETAHASDFTTVVWYGQRHVLTRTQARIVRSLWAEWESCEGTLSQESILEALDPHDEFPGNRRIKDIFRRSRAWQTLIHEFKKGIYGLRRPKDTATTPL